MSQENVEIVRRYFETIDSVLERYWEAHVEHDIDRVFGFSRRVTVMNQGEVLMTGTPAEVRNDRRVQEVYTGTGQPPGTQSGQKLRLREKGVPSATREGARGDEEVMNVSIGGNVQGCIVATPGLVTIHLRCEVEEELLPQCFGAVCTRYYRGIEASVNDLGEVDLVGFPIDERDASSGQVCFGDGAGPVVGPRVVSEVNGGCPPELRRGLGQITSAVVLSEQRTRCRLQNRRFTGIGCAEEPTAGSKNYDAR